jgi:hypothetical protein
MGQYVRAIPGVEMDEIQHAPEASWHVAIWKP